MLLHVARLCIIGSLESSHIMAMRAGREATKLYCAPSVRSVKTLSLQLRQTFAGRSSSFITATGNIHPRRLGRSSSSPGMVNNLLVCTFLCYYLQAQLTCHDKFYRKYYEFFAHAWTLYTWYSLWFFEHLVDWITVCLAFVVNYFPLLFTLWSKD